MSKYPEVITPEILKSLAHISDEQVATDICETEDEIPPIERAIAAFDEIAANDTLSWNERMRADFSASAKRARNEDRRNFIAFLKRLQAARGIQ